jgi:hypothetical protein
MRLLIDANVFVEVILEQEKAEDSTMPTSM